MGKFKVVFSNKAEKYLDSMSDDVFYFIVDKCKLLENNPMPDGKHIKKLKGYKNLYRLRAGDYRVVFELNNLEVNIARILTRQEFGTRY